MKNKKMFVKRLVMVLIAILLLSTLISFSSIPEVKGNSVSIEDQVINNSQLGYAWITSYDGSSGYDDIIGLQFGHNFGYSAELSDYIGEIVNMPVKSYVINWRPTLLGNTLQVCGMRIAYRLPLAGGYDSSFSYFHIPGSVLLPRASTVQWATDQSGGCIFAESGNTNQIFNINLNIPDGSRIEYLRVYYYRSGEAQLFLPMINK
ncbi:MAG TPA: hypothetical protein VFC66_02690 [Anaerolineaceae bacterium]|nr:hypothetical protein [Anaerolineaceae bacterium]